MSILQDIARERNWYRWMILKSINLRGLRHLKISSYTQARVDRINYEIEKLRDSLDADWKEQRANIKEKQAKSLTAQLTKMVGNKDNPPPVEY